MAQTVIRQLTDDLDGSMIEEGAGKTVRFSLESTAYEIDLSNTNFDRLCNDLRPYIQNARKVRPSEKRSTARRRDTSAIRAWARENGYDLSPRGRIPAEIEAAFDRR